MSLSLGLFLYVVLGLALGWLRKSQGVRATDALFSGLFWPMDQTRRWIELTVRALLKIDAEQGRA